MSRLESIEACRTAGFAGFETVQALRASRLAPVPDRPGVYVILFDGRSVPPFVTPSPAGHFKGRNPTVEEPILHQAWVDGACIVYIGKASGSLRTRLRAYLAHGAGRAAAHWGGRFIWQIEPSHKLLVAWREETEESARKTERALIEAFIDQYGRRPFANRVR